MFDFPWCFPSVSQKWELEDAWCRPRHCTSRHRPIRASLFRRLKVILWGYGAYLHLLYIVFVLAAVIFSTITGLTTTGGTDHIHKLLIYLLRHAFWPPMLCLLCSTACCTPVRYAIWPPTMPDREELLDRNPNTGIARPKEQWKKQRYAKTTFWHETQYSGVTIFTDVVFFGAFFI
jgi:hypothetical protein